MSDDYWRNYDPVDAAMRIAGAPNRLAGGQMDTSDVIGAIPRPSPSAGLLEQLRDRAMRGDVGASNLLAQDTQAKSSAPWFSSEGLAASKPNALGAAISNVPSELMFLSNFLGPKAPRIPNPIKAYHGSPHDFDKFDLSKIGTGEGAQAFGHGLYIAENESVARSYRRFGDHEVDQLTRALQDARDQFKPQDLNADNLRRTAVERFPKLASLPPETWQDAAIAANGKLRNGPGISEEAKNAYDRIYARHPKPEGHMYEVNIHASPDQFLDWDKPLSQQSEAVRKALADQIADQHARRAEFVRKYPDSDFGEATGQNLAPRTAEELDAIKSSGIPGIRYLDQGSRGTGAGTSNYVVFSPEILEILRKYGLAGTLGASSIANALMPDNKDQ